MAITRRQFIKRTGLVAAGSFLGPSLFRNPLLREALAAAIGDRYFVVVYLDGGNDGLNTVVPASGSLRAAYQVARVTGTGGLQLPVADLAATAIGNDPGSGGALALHPGLIGLKSLYDLGKVAVLQGCGYPSYNLSHELSRGIFQTANPLGAGSTLHGWMGRYLAANYLSTDIPAVNIGSDVAGEFEQTTTSVLALERLRNFGFPYDSYQPSDKAAKRACFYNLYTDAAGETAPTPQYCGDTGSATLAASESYPPLSASYVSDRLSFNQSYDTLNTSFARDLREVAKVMYGVKNGVPNVEARFFEVRNGGYDTHSDQGTDGPNDQHYQLHREVGDAINAFYADCADMGLANKLCMVVWSEFSRRITQNANGTDHGSQGPMFVVGGTVNGGVYGNHPNINPAALDSNGNTAYSQTTGDPFRSTDIRDVYGTILQKWLGMADALTVLPVDTGNANTYWTMPNFNMGFLP